MTAEPCWIVDETTGLLTYVQDGSELDYVSRRSMHAGGYDALVECVRKAEHHDQLVMENEDLRWLVGWLARHGGIDMLPPRLVPTVQAAVRDMSWSRFTVAGPYSLVPDGESTDD